MTTEGLEVRLRQGREHIDLRRFTKDLEEIATALREIDEAAARDQKRISWVVEELSTLKDWLTVKLVVRPDQLLERPPSSVAIPVDALVAGVQSLNSESRIPQFYSPATIGRLIKVGKPGRGVNEVSLASTNGTQGPEALLSEEFRTNASRAVRGQSESFGSVVGIVDILNLRTAKSKVAVSILDETTRRPIRATASREMLEELREALGRRVALLGSITRNPHGQPIKMTARSMRFMPMVDERPSVNDVLGIAPDWLSGQRVEDYIAEVRRG